MIDFLTSHFIEIFELGFLAFAAIIFGAYFIQAAYSTYIIWKTKRNESVTRFNNLLSSEATPTLSIIAPAYNESATIVDNIRSMLAIQYPDLKLIIVNDGSKDNTLQLVIDNYNMELDESCEVDIEIDCKPIRGIYRSKTVAYRNLILVDKENGRKADALNAGINVCDTEYFAGVDVDCLIVEHTFLTMIHRVMRNNKERVVAVGGMIGLTNGSVFKKGRLMQLKFPKSNIARFQVLEYFRAFLFGRTAWNEANGLLIISGALGLFDRDAIVEVGGYDHSSVGEDMELVMRLHAHFKKKKEAYKIDYVPDFFCWTEAPEDYKVLKSQRKRWARGTIDTLLVHKQMNFKYKYGLVGLLSAPFWFLSERCTPLIEVFGIVFVTILFATGGGNAIFCLALLLFCFSLAIFLTGTSIFVQQVFYRKYTNSKDIMTMFLYAMLEPFIHHPKVVYWGLLGNIDYFKQQDTGWGNMVRKGFNTK